MKDIEKYRELLTQKLDKSNRRHLTEILQVFDQSKVEMELNFEKLNMNEIIEIFGTPESFINEYTNDRDLEPAKNTKMIKFINKFNFISSTKILFMLINITLIFFNIKLIFYDKVFSIMINENSKYYFSRTIFDFAFESNDIIPMILFIVYNLIILVISYSIIYYSNNYVKHISLTLILYVAFISIYMFLFFVFFNSIENEIKKLNIILNDLLYKCNKDYNNCVTSTRIKVIEYILNNIFLFQVLQFTTLIIIKFMSDKRIKNTRFVKLYLNKKRIIELFNFLLYTLLIIIITLLPLIKIVNIDKVIFSLNAVQIIRSSGIYLFIPSIILLIIYPIILYILQKEVLYREIKENSNYFKKYIMYLFLLGVLSIMIQQTYLFRLKAILYNIVLPIKECRGGSFILTKCDYFFLDQFLEWIFIWVYGVQMLILGIYGYFRSQSTRLEIMEFKDIDEIEVAVQRSSFLINRLYKINVFLIILIYVPSYIYLLISNNSYIILITLIFTDFIITIIIGIQFFIFSAVIYNKVSIEEKLDISSISSSKFIKFQIVYILYVISTFFPDNYSFNTDGFIVVTSFFAVPFLLLIWISEYFIVPYYEQEIIIES